MENLVKFIRSRIDHLGLTPRQVSQKSGVDEGELSRLLNGKRGPTLLNLKRLSPVLEVPITDLLALGGHVEKNVMSFTPELPVIPIVGEAMAGHIRANTHLGNKNNKTLEGAKAIIVRGDSMKPIAGDGDVIIYNENLTVHNGDLVYCKIKGHGSFFKRYFSLSTDEYANLSSELRSHLSHDEKETSAHSCLLMSVNTEHALPIICISNEIEFKYKVIAVQFK